MTTYMCVMRNLFLYQQWGRIKDLDLVAEDAVSYLNENREHSVYIHNAAKAKPNYLV